MLKVLFGICFLVTIVVASESQVSTQKNGIYRRLTLFFHNLFSERRRTCSKSFSFSTSSSFTFTFTFTEFPCSFSHSSMSFNISYSVTSKSCSYTTRSISNTEGRNSIRRRRGRGRGLSRKTQIGVPDEKGEVRICEYEPLFLAGAKNIVVGSSNLETPTMKAVSSGCYPESVWANWRENVSQCLEVEIPNCSSRKDSIRIRCKKIKLLSCCPTCKRESLEFIPS